MKFIDQWICLKYGLYDDDDAAAAFAFLPFYMAILFDLLFY